MDRWVEVVSCSCSYWYVSWLSRDTCSGENCLMIHWNCMKESAIWRLHWWSMAFVPSFAELFVAGSEMICVFLLSAGLCKRNYSCSNSLGDHSESRLVLCSSYWWHVGRVSNCLKRFAYVCMPAKHSDFLSVSYSGLLQAQAFFFETWVSSNSI